MHNTFLRNCAQEMRTFGIVLALMLRNFIEYVGLIRGLLSRQSDSDPVVNNLTQTPSRKEFVFCLRMFFLEELKLE